MRSAGLLVLGIVIGILMVFGGLQVAQAFGQSMKDPTVLQSMRDAMDDPQMRQMMEQMYDMMRRR